MINKTGQELFLISANDGEVLATIQENESFVYRDKRQTLIAKRNATLKEVNKNKRFVKSMIVEERKIIEKLQNYPSTYMALNIMKYYLVQDHNILVKNGIRYKATDLAKEMKISRQMAYEHIKKLKQLNIILEVESDINGEQQKVFAINPYIICNGNKVPSHIIKAFEKV